MQEDGIQPSRPGSFFATAGGTDVGAPNVASLGNFGSSRRKPDRRLSIQEDLGAEAVRQTRSAANAPVEA
jgi:hypothetical protein